MSLYHSFSKILCIKPVIAILPSSDFSALSPSGFTILQRLALHHHHFSCFMLLFSLHVFSFVWFGRQSLPFSSPLCVFVLHRQNVSDCQGLTVGVYLCAAHAVCIPILPHRCWLLRERASSVGPSRSCFMKKHHSNFLWIGVQFTEAHGRNTSSGHPVTILYLLCLYHSVNSIVQNAFVHAFAYFTRAFFMTAVLICFTCN